MCMGGPKIQAPPPPPPAPPPPTPMARLTQGVDQAFRRKGVRRNRSGISSLRISSGTNTNSSGTGVNV